MCEECGRGFRDGNVLLWHRLTHRACPHCSKTFVNKKNLKRHNQVRIIFDTVQGGSQPHPSGRSLKMRRGQRDTLDAVPCHCSFQVWLWLHCVWHGIKHQWQLDSIHNSGLRLALGAFCTSPVSSLYTEANEAPLEERRLKLSMHYYVKTRACIDNPAHHALDEFDRTTRDLYAPRPNGRGGMTRTPAPPIGLKVEEAMTSAEINAELVCPLRTPNFPPGTHDYDPKRHGLIEGVSKCMISGQEAQAKFNEFREAQGSDDEVYTDGSKMKERVGAAAVINRHFKNGKTTCRRLSKRLPDNSTIFAVEGTAISLALNYYQHMGPVHHDVVVYSDSMSCLQAIRFGDNTDLLWWNNVNNQFCQLTTRLSYKKGIRRPFKCTGNHTYWCLKNNWDMQSKNGLQNLWGNIVFFILC